MHCLGMKRVSLVVVVSLIQNIMYSWNIYPGGRSTLGYIPWILKAMNIKAIDIDVLHAADKILEDVCYN